MVRSQNHLCIDKVFSYHESKPAIFLRDNSIGPFSHLDNPISFPMHEPCNKQIQLQYFIIIKLKIKIKTIIIIIIIKSHTSLVSFIKFLCIMYIYLNTSQFKYVKLWFFFIP